MTHLLRYYPVYSQLLPEVLNGLAVQGVQVGDHDAVIRPTFFGCGPVPELAGLLRYLQQSGQSATCVLT